MMQPRRHSLFVPDTAGSAATHELVFYDWGNVQASKTTVCVHGLTRSARDFDPLAQALVASGRRVFAFNMAGRGESARLADPMLYHYGTYVNDCLAIMDNFHLREVEWIGTSMGGIIGMTIAANQRNRITKLVLNDIGTVLRREALGRIYDYVRGLQTHFDSRRAAEEYLAVAFEPFGITDPAQWQQFVDSSLLTGADGSIRYACDPAIVDPIRAATKDFTDIQDIDLSHVWEQVRVPTLIIHGERSDILDTATIRAMRLTHPRADSVTIAGVGHAPPLMSAEQTRLVKNWLDRTAATVLETSF